MLSLSHKYGHGHSVCTSRKFKNNHLNEKEVGQLLKPLCKLQSVIQSRALQDEKTGLESLRTVPPFIIIQSP